MSHQFLAILVLIIAPLTYSWRVDYSCIGCTESYYRSGTDQAQFIFSEIDYGIIGFDIWLAQGSSNTTAYRVAVLGEDVSTTTYVTDFPANLTSNDNYYFNVQANDSASGLVLGPFGIQAPQPSSSSSSGITSQTSSAGSPTGSPTGQEDSGSGDSTPTIVGAVVGSVGGIALILGAVFFVRRRNKQTHQDNPAAQNLMNNNYNGGAPPPPPQGYPAPQGQDMQYVPPPVVTYASSPQQPEPPASFHSIKPDAPPVGAQYQSAPKQSQYQTASKPQQYQNPNVPESPPAPPYRYQSPHVPDEVSYQIPHSH